MTDPVAAFLEAACVPLVGSHASGTLDEAQAMLAAHPEIARHDIHTAAVLGDDEAVRSFLAADSASTTAPGGPRGWDALTHLCFSRYLRLDSARSGGFVRAAAALLDAGASPNTGWFERNHQPEPEWESALYGAAGVAHHEALTRLLLDRGADPNDGETPYHAPETYEMGAFRAIVESGKLNEDSLATMLHRKCDWHHLEAVRYLLSHGAKPNRITRWGRVALHHALLRDNALAIIVALLDHGADPTIVWEAAPGRGEPPVSSVSLAARRGRGDVLDLLASRGLPVALDGVDRLIAACARVDDQAIQSIVSGEPALIGTLLAEGGTRLVEFAGNGNTDGVRRLLELGVDVSAVHTEGDGYFSVAPNSTALHAAAWRARHETVKFPIDRGAPIDARDGAGRTALALAVKACVDSWWTRLRSPESVAALLAAGASADGVPYPSGYAEVDALLTARVR